jgi:uncharacterized protein YbjQ (UPF0145 family)
MIQAGELDAAAIALGALHRLGELKGGKSGSVFTSDLSVSEFLLVQEVGFRPLGLVLGSSVYHIGFQRKSSSETAELEVLSHAMSHARELAMTRMKREAGTMGADGVVGVRLEVQAHDFASDISEFVAIGTAVQAERRGGGKWKWRNQKGQPFTSDLSGQDFCALIKAGYAPLGMVIGSCVYHIALQRLGQMIGNFGRNLELEQVTRALYDARELAMGRLQAAAQALQAEGIVGVQLHQHSRTWGSHTTEFLAIGTAVRPLREDHEIKRPTMVLELDH